MAQRSGLSHTTVSRIWPADPFFIEKVRDIACAEKSQIQALDRTRPLLPLRPGQVERRTHFLNRQGDWRWSSASM